MSTNFGSEKNKTDVVERVSHVPHVPKIINRIILNFGIQRFNRMFSRSLIEFESDEHSNLVRISNVAVRVLD